MNSDFLIEAFRYKKSSKRDTAILSLSSSCFGRTLYHCSISCFSTGHNGFSRSNNKETENIIVAMAREDDCIATAITYLNQENPKSVEGHRQKL